MKPTTRQRSTPSGAHSLSGRRLQEMSMIASFTASVFCFLALVSYHRADPGWSHASSLSFIGNWEGQSGAWVADFLYYFLGLSAFILPCCLFILAWQYYRSVRRQQPISYYLHALPTRLLGLLCIIISLTTAASLFIGEMSLLPAGAGGVLGQYIGWHMLQLFSAVGSALISLAILFSGLSLLLHDSLIDALTHLGNVVMTGLSSAWETILNIDWGNIVNSITRLWTTRSTYTQENIEPARVEPSLMSTTATPAITATTPQLPQAQPVAKAKPAEPKEPYVSPSIDLLDDPKPNKKAGYTPQQLEAMSREVELRLLDFNVQVRVVGVNPGPVVTRFELQLAAGTKVSKISGLAKDLARSLSVTSVRVVEVIPGKSVIGLELPNAVREMVRLKEVIRSQQYQTARSPLTVGLGKDISGHPVVVDLAKMPHLLVAGTTGSGKSVGLNAMLLSLLYKSTPEQLRLILIDPKMLELATYEGIPHLLTPVVTDMNEAASALRWCVAEMERRYQLMAAMGVRNIAGFNSKIQLATKAGKTIMDPLWNPQLNPEGNQECLKELPHIVVLADEFADMMMVVGKKLETLITRIAQKARAAGIHLILATQRPSVDVITGLIKANIPTRMAFQVSSRVDSRTILDQQGADQLLGHGDMLYLPPGSGVPVRVHGAYVADDEVHRVVKRLKRMGGANYQDDILRTSEDTGDAVTTAQLSGVAHAGDASGEKDALYDEAVKIVTTTRRASISNVQRRLKIGYNRSANLMEAMEEAGVVSKMENNGTREVLAPPPPEAERD